MGSADTVPGFLARCRGCGTQVDTVAAGRRRTATATCPTPGCATRVLCRWKGEPRQYQDPPGCSMCGSVATRGFVVAADMGMTMRPWAPPGRPAANVVITSP